MNISKPELEILASVPLFAGLGEGTLDEAAAMASIEGFAAGEAIFSEGGEAGRLGVILSGKAEVHKRAGGARVLISVLGPGSMIGAASLFINGAATVTEVTAVRPSRALFLSEEALRSLMRRDFALAENYMRYLTGRIRFLTGRIESIGSPSAADKLMNYLALNSEDGRAVLPMGYSALADALCVSRASLYRALDSLEEQQKLRRDGRTIYIMKTED